MERPVFDEGMSHSILNEVHEDMHVRDSTGEEIGKVREVFLASVSEQKDNRGTGPATVSERDSRDKSLIDYLAEIFADNPLPEVVRERLLRQGFIRIDTEGLFASDRFALPDQIESVSDDCVRLQTTKDELIAA